MEIGTTRAVALGCGTGVFFPVSLNFVPHSNLISLRIRATNYHKHLFKSPPFNLLLLDTDFEIQVSPFLCNIPWLAKFTMQNEI